MESKRDFVCKNCNSVYKSRYAWKRHFQKCHQGESYDCKKCGRRYLSEGDCKTHVRKEHAPTTKSTSYYVVHRRAHRERSATPPELTDPAAIRQHLQGYPSLGDDGLEVVAVEHVKQQETGTPKHPLCQTPRPCTPETPPELQQPRVETSQTRPPTPPKPEVGLQMQPTVTAIHEVSTGDPTPPMSQEEVYLVADQTNTLRTSPDSQGQEVLSTGSPVMFRVSNAASSFAVCLEQSTTTVHNIITINRRIYCQDVSTLPSSIPWELFYGDNSL